MKKSMKSYLSPVFPHVHAVPVCGNAPSEKAGRVPADSGTYAKGENLLLYGGCIIFVPVFGRFVPKRLGVPGFDSRQSLMVSTPSAVWRLVNPDARTINGNNSYALAA